jgi:hypothetical protein
MQGTPENGCSTLIAGEPEQREKRVDILFIFWWKIWKEHNRRIFDLKEHSHSRVADLTIEAINLYSEAWCGEG